MNTKKIIPTVFAYNKNTFDQKLKNLSFAKELHIDFMDGEFTEKKSVTLDDMTNIKDYPNINFGIHLMANEPLEYIGKIKKLGIKTIFIHYEAFETDTELQYTIETFKEKGLKVGLAINPSTEIEDVLYYEDILDKVMLMSVFPGEEGQKFISHTYSRIEELKKQIPHLEVSIDGGIDDTNAQEVIKAGSDVLCIGSYISSSDNPKKYYDTLTKIIK